MSSISSAFSLAVSDGTTLLSSIAEGLVTPGNSVDAPALANPLSLVHDVQWQTISAYYDPINRELHYMGKPASNDSPYPHEFNHYLYDEVTNTWYRTMSAQLKGVSGSGHIWNTCFDFETGEYWVAPRATEFFRKFDRAAWVAAGRPSVAPATGIPSWWSTVTNTGPADLLYSTQENFNGCAIHPNLFGPGDKGLVCIDGIYIYGYRFQNGQWIRLSSDFYSTDLSGDTSGGAGWYIASQDIVCVGGGTLAAGGNGRVWRVPAGSGGTHPANSQKGAQLPINVQGAGSAVVAGKIIIHPSLPDRLLILEKNGTNRVWKSDNYGASWELLAGVQHPFNTMQTGGNEGSWTAASIGAYGVIMGIGSKQGSKIRLWRPPVDAPAWVGTHLTTLNAWTQLPNVNVFDQVRLGDIGQGGTSRGVFTAWGGAAYIPTLGVHGSMVHWNGGHTDYHGNEVYRFDLSTLTWERVNDPSGPPYFADASEGDNWADGLNPVFGTPNVPHTYNMVGARTANGTFWTFVREKRDSGGNDTLGLMSFFNFSTETWFNSTQAKPIIGGSGENTCCYDDTRDGVWCLNAYGDVAFYNCVADTWTGYTGPGFTFGESQITHCPSKDCLVAFVRGTTNLRGIDCASPNTQSVALNVTGSGPPTWNNVHSCRWSSKLGKLFYYYTGGGASLWSLTPPSGDWRTGTWTWAQVPVTGAPIAPTGESGGVYGKFQIVEWDTVVVGILNNRYQGPCQAIRLQ